MWERPTGVVYESRSYKSGADVAATWVNRLIAGG